MDLQASDVGRRVVIRRLTGEYVEGRPQMTDVLGYLVAAGDAALVVRRSDGREVGIPTGDVVAAKVVPEPPARRRPVAARRRPEPGPEPGPGNGPADGPADGPGDGPADGR